MLDATACKGDPGDVTCIAAGVAGCAQASPRCAQEPHAPSTACAARQVSAASIRAQAAQTGSAARGVSDGGEGVDMGRSGGGGGSVMAGRVRGSWSRKCPSGNIDCVIDGKRRHVVQYLNGALRIY